ncbi:MAG: hypothetical protein ACP5M4_09060 [Acidobacteriaceae bacterium]
MVSKFVQNVPDGFGLQHLVLKLVEQLFFDPVLTHSDRIRAGPTVEVL